MGVLRSPRGLLSVRHMLDALVEATTVEVTGSRRAWEATNLLTVATAVAMAATARTESRGCHRRTDWTEQRDEWLTHLDVRLDATGRIAVAGGPRDDG